MGRKKLLDDNRLIELIRQYYYTVCKGCAYDLKLPKIAEYIRANGHPDYTVESLRRNKIAREYIDKLKANAEEKERSLLISYKTLDAEAFLNTHATRAARILALTELDAYYKSIADAAIVQQKKYDSLLKTHLETVDLLELAGNSNEDLIRTIASLKTEIKILAAEKASYKKTVEDFVLPDVAKELLIKDGVLKNESTIIDPDKLDKKIITGQCKIEHAVKPSVSTESKLIQGLFDKLEE